MHTSAIICFVLAVFFYSFAWSDVAAGLAVIGVFFEAIAWIFVFSNGDDK